MLFCYPFGDDGRSINSENACYACVHSKKKYFFSFFLQLFPSLFGSLLCYACVVSQVMRISASLLFFFFLSIQRSQRLLYWLSQLTLRSFEVKIYSCFSVLVRMGHKNACSSKKNFV